MLKDRFNFKKVQDNVVEKSKNVWFAGLGVYAAVGDESSKLYQKAVETGKDLVEKGRKVERANRRKEAKGAKEAPADSRLDQATQFVGDKVRGVRDAVIQPLGVSSHSEVKELTDKVDKLTEIVAVLAQKLDTRKAVPAKTATV